MEFPLFILRSSRDIELKAEVDMMLVKGVWNHLRQDPFFLQLDLPGGEGIRMVETCLRSNAPQLSQPFVEVQDRNSNIGLSLHLEENFMISVPWKDVYLPIPIHPNLRPFLWSPIRGQYIKLKLCFCLLRAPQVFTRVLSLISTWTHGQDNHHHLYLDDCHIIADYAICWAPLTFTALQWPGDCCQTEEIRPRAQDADIKFWNISGYHLRERVYPLDSQITRFQVVAAQFLSIAVSPVRMWERFPSHMASLKQFVHHGRTRMCPLQWPLKAISQC